MGLVYVNIEVGNENGGEMVRIPDVMVDTGSLHTLLPEKLLDDLRVDRKDTVVVEFGDGERGKLSVGQINIKIDGYMTGWWCPVYFDPTNTNHLLGATTLEIFGLVVDPSDGTIETRITRARPL